MASSALQQSNSVPEFEDPFDYNYADVYNRIRGFTNDTAKRLGFTGESGIPGFLSKLFGYDVDQMKANATAAAEMEYDRQSINSARAWSEYMENTQYQRRVADIEAAGLNPWLAVQNGISGTGSPSVDTGGSAKHQTKSDQSMNGLAALLMAIAKLVA